MPKSAGSRSARSGTDRGQSETISVVLLITMTIMGTTLIVALGATALDSAKLSSQNREVGHAMTQLDSQAAIVALGDSDVQEFSLGNSGEGYYYIDEDAGWINITHHNRTGSGNVETIANKTMGAVIYENGDTEIAYQGGGVWRGTGANSTMVSPPEFHYRAATLTFPLIRVEGNGSAAGPVSGRITLVEQAHRLFPNASDEYDGSSDPYLNPIENGTVTIKIHSAYYKAWEEYFRSRSSGDVTVWDTNDTVKLELTATGTLGDFEMPAEGNKIELRGLGEAHPLTDFNITLYADDEDNADFSNLKWSLSAEQGSKQFEIHLRDSSGGGCGGDARATVYYSDNNGADYQAWTNQSAFQYECEGAGEDFNDDGDSQDLRLVANFTSQTDLEYDKVQGGDAVTMVFDVKGSDDFIDSTTFDEHSGTISWEAKDFDRNDETSIDNVTNHYISFLGPSVDLKVTDKSGNTVNEEQSHGTIAQKGGTGEFLTFLHITENRIEIEFE